MGSEEGPGPFADAARAIVESMQATWSKPLTVVPARGADFAHLDLRAYANARADLESRGVRYLDDIEILEVSNAPGSFIARTMIREFLSADGRTAAGYYQVRPRVARVLGNLLIGLLGLRWIAAPRFALSVLTPRNVVEFESELSDGRFVTTSNAETAGMMGRPPTADAVHSPYGTATDKLLQDHERRLGAHLAAAPDVSVVTLATLDDVRQMERRLHAQKSAYRASIQWVSREELRAMSGDERLADEVFAEVQKLMRRQT